MLSIILNGLRIIAISDTHGRHRSLHVPEADVIIHTGDACEDGDEVYNGFLLLVFGIAGAIYDGCDRKS
jgi:predicted phosphodiesterase